MTNNHFVLPCLVALFLATNTVMAEIQSPIYTDEIGRAHFLGKGGYSSVRQLQMGEVQSNLVNDAANNFSKKQEPVKEEVTNTIEPKITDVIKEKPVVPAASHKSTFTSEKAKMDPSKPYGYGSTYIPAGVNNSKTIYTDELGRLHFFGKANKIKE